MTFLPIVDRELRVASRLTATYRNRALTAAVVALVAMAMLLFGAFVPFPSRVGGRMFATLSFLIAVFCGLEGLRKTADCLSEEKREGTLGLLFLTDLKGYDVILGKLSATSLNSIYGLLAMLPILALSLMLGGVTPGEFWRMALALANLLFFSLCAGIWVSARSESERNAVAGTLLLIVSLLFFPGLGSVDGLHVISPIFAYGHAFSSAYSGDPGGYWRSLLITQLLCWLLLAWASRTVRWSWREKIRTATELRWKERREQWRFGGATQRAKLRAQLLEINPVLWLVSRNVRERLIRWFLPGIWVAIMLIFTAYNVNDLSESLTVVMLSGFCINLVWLALLGSQASQNSAEIRRDNALELLLSTPFSVDQIIHGQILALKRAFLAPILASLLLEIMGLPCAVYVRGEVSGVEVIICVVGTVSYLLLFALNALAMTWTGMWFGLSSKSGNQAAFKPLLYVLLPPLLGLPLCFFGLPILFVWPLIWFLWSKQKVQSEFRKLALQQYSFDPKTSGWWSNQANNPAQTPLPFTRKGADFPQDK